MSYGHHHHGNLPNPRDKYEIRLLAQGNDLAVQMDEMKLALRVDSDDEDMTIRRNIRAMTDFFTRRTGWVLTPCTFEALVGGCGNHITIERGPYRSITGFFYWDCEAREWVQIDNAEITVEERGNEFDLLLSQTAYNLVPAPSHLRPRPIRIQFEAGFDSPEVSETTVNGTAEDGMVQSLMGLVQHVYDIREAGDKDSPAKDFLLGTYRKFW